MKDELKEAFKNCMRHLYPSGNIHQIQVRDMVRVFAMGWAEALIYTDNKVAGREYITVGEELCKEGWLPDESWIWWDIVNPSQN